MRWTALVAALILAGCATDVERLTAMDNLEAAELAATRWSPDVALIGTGTVEARDQSLLNNASNDFSLSDASFNIEDSVADGRAAAWAYLFWSQAKSLAYEIVVSNGQVIQERSSERENVPESIDLTAWRLDSDEAAQRAARASTTMRDARQAADAWSATLLVAQEHGVYWLFVVSGGEARAMVSVDGLSGEAEEMDLEALPSTFFTPVEAGSLSGQVSVVEPTEELRFTTELEHGLITVAITAPVALPSAMVNVTVAAPDGRTTYIEEMQFTPDRGLTGRVALADPIAGDYNVTVELVDGAVLEYDLSWCTDGFGFFFAPQSPGHACSAN